MNANCIADFLERPPFSAFRSTPVRRAHERSVKTRLVITAWPRPREASDSLLVFVAPWDDPSLVQIRLLKPSGEAFRVLETRRDCPGTVSAVLSRADFTVQGLILEVLTPSRRFTRQVTLGHVAR
jgi:hypothetical protein